MNSSPFEVRRRDGTGPFVIVCDHASNFVPDELHDLGLSTEELSRHIGWDIGAAGIAEVLSERLDSPAVFCGTSRLVIDCNRQLEAPDLIPEVSDGTRIPGNSGLSERDRRARIERYFEPYHDAVERVVEGRPNAIFLSIHSMTAMLRNEVRPWPMSFSTYRDRSLAERLIPVLKESTQAPVGHNEPYDLDPEVDYTTPYHAIRRGLPHLQVEFRQDGIGTAEGQRRWAGYFADALEKTGIAPGLPSS